MDKEHLGSSAFPLQAQDFRGKTRYPIVIHHGVLPLLTLHKFAKNLREHGFIAYSAQTSALNSPEFRAKQLAVQINRVLVHHQSEKVNIIAHSAGGVDARYLISVMGWGDRVASLTTVSTPHRGSFAAERVFSWLDPLLFPFANLILGTAIDGSLPFTVDTRVCFFSLTREYMQNEFNPKVLDNEHVYYQSWAGESGSANVPADLIHFWIQAKLTEVEGPNDGIVSVASAKWGNFRGTLPAAHATQIGKPTWLGGNSDYDAFAQFETFANDLVDKGF